MPHILRKIHMALSQILDLKLSSVTSISHFQVLMLTRTGQHKHGVGNTEQLFVFMSFDTVTDTAGSQLLSKTLDIFYVHLALWKI